MKNIDKLQTPCYLIDEDELEYNINRIKSSFSKHWRGPLCIGYSVKTNHLKWILEYMKDKGVFAEVVSRDEYLYSRRLGFSPSNIIFNGPYKDKEILEQAVSNGSIVNLDSFAEIESLKEFSKSKTIEVGLRINFDLEKMCPGETAMGDEPSRFGFCVENGEFERALKLCDKYSIKVVGIHVHQSTKTRSLKIYSALAKQAIRYIREYDLEESLKYIDIGGGFFGGRDVLGKPTFDEYATAICEELSTLDNSENIQLIIEPGASVIATPISYISKVIDIKDVRQNRIVTVDGSILHIDPFITKRQSSYKLYSGEKPYKDKQVICGSTCMENDRLIYLKQEKALDIGDIIQIEKCGSYTMCYNSCFINLPPAVYAKKGKEYIKVREAWNFEVLLH